jgi:hypothetical protein
LARNHRRLAGQSGVLLQALCRIYTEKKCQQKHPHEGEGKDDLQQVRRWHRNLDRDLKAYEAIAQQAEAARQGQIFDVVSTTP